VSLDFSKFDGSGRKPRAVQTRFLNWLSENWNEATCFAGQLPVACGKSAIAKAIQLATSGHTITPSNILIDQYVETYPKDNFLKGKAHYRCHSGLSCQEWTDVLEQEPCLGCPYQECRLRARKESTFFNPLSYYYFNMPKPGAEPREPTPVLIVDEAHQLPQMILMMTAKKFRKSQYKFDDRCTSAVFLEQWLVEQIRKLDKLANVYKQLGDYTKLREIVTELESMGLVLDSLRDNPENYAIYLERGLYRGKPDLFLNVRPVKPPRKVTQKMLSCVKLVILSGTLFPSDIEDLATDRVVKFLDLPSPIPKEKRPIFYSPTSFRMNVDTDPRDIVEAIEKVLERYPNRNTIIHTTYSQSAKLIPHFRRPILHNTVENKNDVLSQFRRHGGVFLASGCAEGLDLKDGLCRLNIIPRLSRPDLKDPVVQKRKALSGGDEWYALETLKVCIQQAGRSTRHEKDHSVTVIMDPLFSQLISRYKSKLPISFTEAIKWCSL
jgi:hypothetical protein